MSLEVIIGFVVVVFLSYFIASVTGFGGGLLSTPFLALFIDLKTVTPILVLSGFLLNLDIIRTSWKDIKWKITIILSLFSFVGIYVGVQLLFSANLDFLKIVLAVFIFLAGLNILFNQPLKLKTTNIYFSAIAGLVSGFFQGLFNTGGPPLVIYLSGQNWLKENFRATLVGVFSITGLLQLGLLFQKSAINLNTLSYTVLLIPLILLSSFLGKKVHLKLSQKNFSLLVGSLLLIASISLFLKR
ncbi:MAG: sulfite exporter TauE/SafE family protein [bacterium]